MNDFVQMLRTNRMSLIMSLSLNDPALSRAAFEAGADAVKVHANLVHRASGRSFGTVAENAPLYRQMLAEARGPMGLVPGADAGVVLQEADAACALGFSFFSMYAHHVPAALPRRGQALMAACDGSYGLAEVVAFAQTGVDVLEASVIPGDEYGQPLNLRDVLRYRLLCEGTTLPVVVPTQRAVRPEDLPALADAGVKAVMVGAVVTGEEQETIVRTVSAFREAIEKL